MTVLRDGIIELRPPRPEDRERLLVRDEQHVRFMGAVAEDATPSPTFAVTVDETVVGWVDFDRDERAWLDHTQVNIGYALQPEHRGNGYASRAVMLLLHHLAQDTDVATATLLVAGANEWSLPIARRCGFTDAGTLGDEGARFFTKPVPPLTYTDGTVTIRPYRLDDLDADIEAGDDEHIRWIWRPGEQQEWDALTVEEQRALVRGRIEARIAGRNGPKWSFVIEADGRYAGAVECDLANRNMVHGESNIGYWAHPAARGRGYVSRAVRLALQFLREHTGAREAQIGVHEDNEASLRVARAVGGVEILREGGGVRHRIALSR
jgi:RimJ/RimL family protein N-acetyltransferase